MGEPLLPMRTLLKTLRWLFAQSTEEQQRAFDWLGEAPQASAALHISTGPHRPLRHG
jgi:hypothetical protein